jgi:hypothetical protein
MSSRCHSQEQTSLQGSSRQIKAPSHDGGSFFSGAAMTMVGVSGAGATVSPKLDNQAGLLPAGCRGGEL